MQFGNRVRNRQAGSSKVKALVWTGLLIAFVYICILVVPLYVADYQFRDQMESAAQFASVNRLSIDAIRQNLFKQAEQADMPLKLEDIKVVDHNGRIDIEANYSVTVDLHVYQWTLNFHPTASNSRLM
jgi:predicted membrane protein